MASSDSENSFRTASSDYSDSECGSDRTSDGGSMLHIQPYMFEPKRAVSEREVACAEDGEDNDDRLGNLDWCSCGHCQIMGKAIECLCCKECEITMSKLPDNLTLFGREDYIHCITDHKGFHSVCLDPFVLQVAWQGYKQHYENGYEGPMHKKY